MSEQERKPEQPKADARPPRPDNIPPPSKHPPHISTQGYPPKRD